MHATHIAMLSESRTTLASRTFSDERLLAVWGASWDRLGANLGSHPPVSSMLDVTGYVSSMHDETVSLMHNETRQIAISRSGLGVTSQVTPNAGSKDSSPGAP